MKELITCITKDKITSLRYKSYYRNKRKQTITFPTYGYFKRTYDIAPCRNCQKTIDKKV
jgi:hypothetical protein